MPDFTEQRASRRHKAKVRVLFFRDGSPLAVDAESDNISTSGVFVATRRRPPAVGTPVSLLLNIEGTGKELMIEGVVRWQGQRAGESPPSGDGMGIEFTRMEPAVRELLQRSIAKFDKDID